MHATCKHNTLQYLFWEKTASKFVKEIFFGFADVSVAAFDCRKKEYLHYFTIGFLTILNTNAKYHSLGIIKPFLLIFCILQTGS